MIDPVVCVDGFSYERLNIEEWFRTQSSSSTRIPVVYTSPTTGQVLTSTVFFPNTNLASAIQQYYSHEGPPRVVDVKERSASRLDLAKTPAQDNQMFLLQFSTSSLGKCVNIAPQRSQVTRSRIYADTAAWYEYIAFSATPSRLKSEQRPRVQFKIGRCKTGWGGLTIGLSPLSPDVIKTADLADYVDANCWWLDGNRWFHSPQSGTTLVPWSTDQLHTGDVISMVVPESGRLCVYMNGVKKLDLEDTGIPLFHGSQLYGFVALTGGYEEVCIIDDHTALE